MLKNFVYLLLAVSSVPGMAHAFGKKEPAVPTLQQEFSDAVLSGDSTRVSQLIKQGADPNGNVYVPVYHGTSPVPALSWAAGNSNIYVVQALVEGGADVNQQYDGASPLTSSVDNTDQFAYLLTHGANPNELIGDSTVIEQLISAAGSDSKVLQDLTLAIHSGGDVVHPNPQTGVPPIFSLPVDQPNQPNLQAEISLLVGAGANINDVNPSGLNIYLYALQRGAKMDILTLLESKGADPAAKDKDGRNALMGAARRGNYELTQYLLATGKFDVNARDSKGDTALTLAAQYQDATAVPVALLEAGACINVIDAKGMTPLAFASSRGQDDLVNVLNVYQSKQPQSCPVQLQ